MWTFFAFEAYSRSLGCLEPGWYMAMYARPMFFFSFEYGMETTPFGFGGWNESKFGVGDITGRGSIEFWTQAKKLTTKWNREAGVNWMS